MMDHLLAQTRKSQWVGGGGGHKKKMKRSPLEREYGVWIPAARDPIRNESSITCTNRSDTDVNATGPRNETWKPRSCVTEETTRSRSGVESKFAAFRWQWIREQVKHFKQGWYQNNKNLKELKFHTCTVRSLSKSCSPFVCLRAKCKIDDLFINPSYISYGRGRSKCLNLCPIPIASWAIKICSLRQIKSFQKEIIIVF